LPQASLSFSQSPDDARDPARAAARLATPARAGHFDELRAADGSLREPWQQFFTHLGSGGFPDLDRRLETIGRQVREDGITYNVYSDAGGAPRPWSLDLLPFIISAAEWTQIEQGLAQRASLLSKIMRDIYGTQRLLTDGLLPPALVLGNPGYLRPLAGSVPAGGTFLHIMAFDLARAADGRWWVVSQRTQSPSGLGYALQNRIITRRLFPDAFREMHVQRLASSYRRLLDTLTRLSATTDESNAAPRVVLLTPGPYSETYFEHAYLARYLGIPLVEGGDLTVRDDRVFLKTLHGLQRVHAIVRRLDDDFCDPLELRPDSTLGVPGLLQAIRARQVVVANAVGSGFLESPALNGFLPAIARRFFDQELLLPSLPSWWCGERAAFEQIGDALADKVIKPTFPNTPYRPAFEPVIGLDLDAGQRALLKRRIEADPDAYTVQDYLPLSQAATWQDGAIALRSAMVRVFAISDGSRWHAMPGGLTRVAAREMQIVSMQRGGSSADTWVLTPGPVDEFSMLPAPLQPEDLVRIPRVVTSRAAENLFWMGRYAERAEFSVRLARAIIMRLSDDNEDAPAVLEAVGELAVQHGLVPDGAPSPARSAHGAAVFERVLQSGLTVANGVTGVEFNLTALTSAASQIRERLSSEHWRLVVETAAGFRDDCARARSGGEYSADEVLGVLAHLGVRLAAITGAQTDRMTRDDGWRLLAIGRHLERLGALARALRVLIECHAITHDTGFDLALELFDSTITYRSMYQSRQELPPLLDLVVMNTDNPRALACVARRLTREIQRLPAGDAGELLAHLPPPDDWPALAELCLVEGTTHTNAIAFAARIADAADAISNDIGGRYFSHATDRYRLLNA